MTSIASLKRFILPITLSILLLQITSYISSVTLDAQTVGTPLSLGAPRGGPQIPEVKGTISGSVVRASSGEVLSGVQVTLVRVGNAAAANPTTPSTPAGRGATADPVSPQPQRTLEILPTVKSDDQGRFVISDVAAGSYRVSATRNGYVQQQFGQRSVGRPGTVINVRAGQLIQDIAFRMIPAGTITGRVTDARGEPLPGITVQALRSVYDSTGKRTMQPVGNTKTNDLGEYRLYWMNPGHYFVNANAAPQGLEALAALSSRQMAAQPPGTPEEAQAMAQAQSILGPGKNPNEEADAGFVMTYYPGSPDASRAASIELQPGSEIHGIDFALNRDRKVHIRGKIVDSTTGKPPQMAQVSVSARDSAGSALDLLGALGGALQGNTYDAMTGEFEVKEVSSGGYFLQVMAQNQQPSTPAGARGANPANTADALAAISSLNTTQVPVDVFGVDIDNLNVLVTPGLTVPGRLRFEGTPPSNPDPNQNPLAAFSISLNSSTGGGGLSLMTILGGNGAGKPAADGTFSLQRIVPGDYKLAVTGLGPNMYVKEARLEQNDILGGLKIGDRVSGQLELTISANAGEVTGTIKDSISNPVTGVQAVLIPDSQRDRHELYKTGITDANGKVTLRGIPPGQYRLFAWEDLDPFSYFDSEILRQYEPQGKVITVKESSKEQVDMRIIPAPAP